MKKLQKTFGISYYGKYQMNLMAEHANTLNFARVLINGIQKRPE